MVRRHRARSPIDQRLDEMHADLCKVFSNPVRVGVLSLLREGEMSVGSLAVALRISDPTASKHLRLMRERGVLATRREGPVIYYRLASPKVMKAFSLLREDLLVRLRKTHRLLEVP